MAIAAIYEHLYESPGSNKFGEGDFIYCIWKKNVENIPLERCHNCKRLMNGNNSKKAKKSIGIGLCYSCAEYESKKKLEIIEPKDTRRHKAYLESGNDEFNQRILRALL